MHPFIKNRERLKGREYAKPSTKKAKKLTITKVTENLSNISQLLMLAIITWGYFYTVVPVVQKEKLEEDIAKLEFEKNTWNSKLETFLKKLETQNKELIERSEELSKLKKEKQLLKNFIASAKDELGTQNDQLNKKQKEIEIANTKLAETYKEINNSEIALYESRKSTLLGNSALPVEWIETINNSTNYIQIFTVENSDRIAELTARTLKDPTSIIPKKIEELRENIDNSISAAERNANENILIDFETGLRERRHLLECKEPDFEQWEIAFKESLFLAQDMVETCTNHKWKNRIENENWTQQQVESIKGNEFWGNQEQIYRRACDYWLPISVERLFREKWTPINHQCSKKLSGISKIILNGDIDKENENLVLTPPSEREVRHELRKLIENW